MDAHSQLQKFKFKLPKFLQKKSSKSTKRGSGSGSSTPTSISSPRNNVSPRTRRGSLGIVKKQQSFSKKQHSKSVECLDDVSMTIREKLRSSARRRSAVDYNANNKIYKDGDDISIDSDCFYDDFSSVVSASCSNIDSVSQYSPERDQMGSNLALAADTFVDVDSMSMTSMTSTQSTASAVMPEKKNKWGMFKRRVMPAKRLSPIRQRMVSYPSTSRLPVEIASARGRADGSPGSDSITSSIMTDTDSLAGDNDSIFSADMTWERENSGSGMTELPTEFKPPRAPVTRQGSLRSRRLSLAANFELPRFRRKHFNLSLKRKRKFNKENDDDSVSVQSLDVSSVSSCSAKKKSKRSLLRVSASLANLISPSRNKNDMDGFKVPSSPLRASPSPYRPPLPSPAKRRVQVTWLDSVSGNPGCSGVPGLSNTDIKRQEAIYELYQGEKDMMEDLENVKKLYRDSLLTLGLMSKQEILTLFGNIDDLTPVHADLSSRLQQQRRPDGTTEEIGIHVHEWCSKLRVYVEYCANQIKAKAIFDEKRNNSAIDDFFQRCLASPFSRKLDLWTLLDGARSRFIKYPLLIRSIQKYTRNESKDSILLEKSVHKMEEIIREADQRTGEARCDHSKASLTYLFDDQKIPEIAESTALLCSGCMKNNKSSKLYVFLFDAAVVCSRSSHVGGRQAYQVYRQPIPISQLLVEDLPDGEVKMGSFRNAFGQGSQTAKNLIRLSFTESGCGQAHTLMANDEHDKRQWMHAFAKITSNILVVPETKGKNKEGLGS